MSRLSVHVLGPPRIERDGVWINVGRRKAIGFLTYIAITGGSHRRDALVNLLWPETNQTRGRAALRRALFALQKALAGDRRACKPQSVVNGWFVVHHDPQQSVVPTKYTAMAGAYVDVAGKKILILPGAEKPLVIV